MSWALVPAPDLHELGANIRSDPLSDSQMHGRSERDTAHSHNHDWDPLGGTVDPLDEFQEQDLEHELVGSQLTWILMIQAHEKPELFLSSPHPNQIAQSFQVAQILQSAQIAQIAQIVQIAQVVQIVQIAQSVVLLCCFDCQPKNPRALRSHAGPILKVSQNGV